MALVTRDFVKARTNAGLSQDEVGAALGMSRSQYGRIELGRSPDVSIVTAARIAAVLSLTASLRLYPTSEPIRDAAHSALLERLRIRCHRSLRWRTEVPLPGQGDLRAWDAVVDGFGRPAVRGGIEAETRPVDGQALERKLALKERDGAVDWMILLLADTRHNRTFLRGPGEALKRRFPLDGRRALELLAAGVDPEASGLVLL
ncbi:MAG: helix-turn-helix transcriptional regulator [Chloroflexi bacterium]|nr:helix-turn-helix transcriptional regulator [Chloroflexota bacterium]